MEKLFPNKGLIRDWISWEREIYNFLSETHAKSAKFCYVIFAKINRLPKKCHNSEPEDLYNQGVLHNLEISSHNSELSY